MPTTRSIVSVLLGCTLGVVAAAPAGAAELPVLGADGRIQKRSDPGVSVRDRTPVPFAHRAVGKRAKRPAGAITPHAATRSKNALGELDRLSAAGTIDPATRDSARAAYQRVRNLGRRLKGRRGAELRGVAATIDGIAARGALTPSRLPALTLTLQRNAEWWGGDGTLLASGARVSFEDSELVWQSVPGQGIQIHPLANFGKLNALWRSRSQRRRMETLLDELLPLRAARAGGDAWEYYFAFGGGNPPWVSSLAQGAGLQATARAAVKAERPEDLATLESGLAIFSTAAPEGVKVPFGGGDHYAQYSYAPKLRIANGFAQSLVGLFDYAELTGSPAARRLFDRGRASAATDLPTFDTGAWSLYSRGSINRESDLHYHGVLMEFVGNLCERTDDETFCGLVERFDEYKKIAPTVSLRTLRLRAGRSGGVRVRLSKIARVRVRLLRGSKTVLDRTAVQGYGTRAAVTITPPRSARRYSVRITATDLAGNTADEARGTIRVLPARRA